MTRTWYTSDLHFWHRRVAEIRGFASYAEHDAAIIRNWNARVRPDDIVWVLGDVHMLSGGLHRVGELNGVKHLVIGNHDSVFSAHRDAHKHQGLYAQYFASMQAFARRKVADVEFLLSHFPYYGDHTQAERFAQYRLRDEGLPLVHGHLHVPDKYDLVNRPNMLHVGLDAWELAPVPQEVVIDELKEIITCHTRVNRIVHAAS